MTALLAALAQGTAGLALVTGFGLLCIRQTSVASILLAVQSGAVALGAVATHRPLMAVPPVLLAACVWLVRLRTNQDARTAPAGGAKLGVTLGAVLAMLCQSQGSLGLPLTSVLLAVLLAATRTHPFMRTIALVELQNGIVMVACLGLPPESAVSPLPALAGHMLPLPALADLMSPLPLLALACLMLPLPLLAGLTIPAVTAFGSGRRTLLGWVDVALAVTVFAATLVIPIDPIASVFAPLLGLDGVLRSEGRRKRRAGAEGQAPNATRFTLTGRGLALLNSIFLILAVSASDPLVAWFAILAAMATAVLPTLRRRWDQATLAHLGAGIVLMGILLQAFLMGYFGLFAGLAILSAVVPDLAAVSVVLLLRLAIRQGWPPGADALGVGIALVALLGCAIVLLRGRRPAVANIGEWAAPAMAGSWPGTSPWTSGPLTIFTQPPAVVAGGWFNPGENLSAVTNVRASTLILGPLARVPRSAAEPDSMKTLHGDRATLLFLSHASIAALAVCSGSPDGRFAALILLILLILSRSAARAARGPIATLAFAGLAGVPPLGVFPGLVLVVLTIGGHDPWLLLPLGLFAIPVIWAGLPSRLPDIRSFASVISIFWVPLLLAILAGYCMPDDLSRWLHAMTAGPP